jgi:ABC-type antimicrobial peptide transport system permease subunit
VIEREEGGAVRRSSLDLEPPSLSVSDALREARLDLTSTLGRSVLTAIGTVIGIAVLVSTLGLASSASARISSRFDALAATEVVARQPEQAGGQTATTDDPVAGAGLLPFDSPARSSVIDGVTSSATLSELGPGIDVEGTPVNDPQTAPPSLTVVGASPSLARTVHAVLTGRFFDAFHDGRGEPVAVLGANAARELHVSDLASGPVILVDDQPVVVIGIVTAVDRHPDLLNQVIVPDGYAAAHLGLVSPKQVIIETRIGAAEVVGRQVAYALRPDVPDDIEVLVPPSPTFTRDRVASDTRALFVVLALVSLVIGGLGIANVTLVSVLERVPEIGLRRSLGAKRIHIAAQFLVESAALGLLGAIAGAAMGVLVVVFVAGLREWPATVEPWLPLLAPVLGCLIGVLAGLYPAVKASRIEPARALRGGV